MHTQNYPCSWLLSPHPRPEDPFPHFGIHRGKGELVDHSPPLLYCLKWEETQAASLHITWWQDTGDLSQNFAQKRTVFLKKSVYYSIHFFFIPLIFFYPCPFIFLKHTQIKICMYTLASSSLLPLFKRVSAWWQKLLPPYLMASNLGLAKWYLALRGCSVKPSWVSGCSCQETASEKHWWIWALKMESGRQRCWHRGGL